jgi:hypothetical protein
MPLCHFVDVVAVLLRSVFDGFAEPSLSGSFWVANLCHGSVERCVYSVINEVDLDKALEEFCIPGFCCAGKRTNSEHVVVYIIS